MTLSARPIPGAPWPNGARRCGIRRHLILDMRPGGSHAASPVRAQRVERDRVARQGSSGVRLRRFRHTPATGSCPGRAQRVGAGTHRLNSWPASHRMPTDSFSLVLSLSGIGGQIAYGGRRHVWSFCTHRRSQGRRRRDCRHEYSHGRRRSHRPDGRATPDGHHQVRSWRNQCAPLGGSLRYRPVSRILPSGPRAARSLA